MFLFCLKTKKEKEKLVRLSFMAFSANLSQRSFSSCLSYSPQPLRRRNPLHTQSITKAVKSSTDRPEKEKLSQSQPKIEAPQPDQPSSSSSSSPSTKPPLARKKVEYSMKKGQIVRVDKDKYLNNINYLSVGHPPYHKGLDYIYENRGEIAWVGIPTAPAWLPTDMLIKSEKLNYERM